MPVYEYGCNTCGSRFEVLQKLSDPPLSTCEKCGAPVKKLISNTSFVLKGSGWYITDYARNGKGGSSSESGAETKTETKTETKSETKTETKSETKSEASSSTAA